MPINYHEQVFHISNYGTGHYHGLIGEPESTTSQVFKVTVRYKNHQYSRNGIVITYDKGKDNDATLKVKLKQAYAKKNQKGVPMNKIMANFNSDLKELKTRGSVLVVL